VAKVGLSAASILPGAGNVAAMARRIAFPGDARVSIPGATTFPTLPMGGRMPPAPLAMPGSGSPAWFAPQNGGAGPDISWLDRLKRAGQALVPGGEEAGLDMEQSPSAMRAGIPAVAGYHWNKTGYFLRTAPTSRRERGW